MAELVRYESVGDVSIVRMDDDKVNALSFAMFDALDAAFDRAMDDRVGVVLTGRRGCFSAGFDLPTLIAADQGSADLVRRGFELAERLLAFPLPIVAACSGHAYAMGAFLLLAVDFRIGVPGPYAITANEVAIGLTMPRAAALLCRGLSRPFYRRAVVQAEAFPPGDAVLAGFLDRLTPEEQLVTDAVEVAQGLSRLPADAYAATKSRVHEDMLDRLRRAIEADAAEFGAILHGR